MEEKRSRQFSIRDVLLLMFIVGLAVGWFVDHHRLADEVSSMRRQMVWESTPGFGPLHPPTVNPYFHKEPLPGETSGYMPNALPSDERSSYIPNVLAPAEEPKLIPYPTTAPK